MLRWIVMLALYAALVEVRPHFITLTESDTCAVRYSAFQLSFHLTIHLNYKLQYCIRLNEVYAQQNANKVT